MKFGGGGLEWGEPLGMGGYQGSGGKLEKKTALNELAWV